MGADLEKRLQDGSTPARTAKPPTLVDQVKSMEEQFGMAMPTGYSASQLVRDAMTAIRETPRLAECDPASALGAFMSCAQLGLRPNVLGQAYVVPYYDRIQRGYRAQFQVGYQGLIELAYRSGRLSSIQAMSVHEHDEFEVEYGLQPTLRHRPCLQGDRGDAVAFYALAKMTDGEFVFYVMSKWEAERFRDGNAPRNKNGQIVGPWRDHFDSMAMKTCVKRLGKFLPKDTVFGTALMVDESVRESTHPESLRNVKPVDTSPAPGVEVPGVVSEESQENEGGRGIE